MKCESRILKEYKTTKADMMWPETRYGPNDTGTLPVCGGDVKVILKAVDEPYFGGCSSRLELNATCSKCKWPFWPGRIQLDQKMTMGELDITELLEG